MNRRTAIFLFGAILLAWTAVVFLPARHFDFVNWDDYDEVVENPLLHPPTTEHLGQIWSEPYLKMYAPLSYSAWWAMAHIRSAADNPAAFHLLNIALHLASVALVFSILLLCVKSPCAAFGGAAIFAVHPVQVESVAWVSEMNNLLAAALSLAAIRLYLAFRVTPVKVRWWYFGLGSAVYLLALFAKATAVVVPLMAAILDWGFLGGSSRRPIAAIFPWLVAAGIFGWIAHLSQSAAPTALMNRPAVAIDALAFYYGKLFWPVGLTIDYGRTPSRVLTGHILFDNLAVLSMLGMIFWVLWRNYRGIVLGGAIMLAGLLPVLGLVPFGFQEYSTVADHFLYLGMLGPSLAAGVILAAAPRRWAIPVAVGLGVALTVLSVKQLQVWRNSGTLVTRALAIDPGSAIGNDIAGAQLDRSGKPSLAIPHFSAAIARDPTNPEFHFNLANALFRLGEFDKSIDEFESAIPLFHPPSWKAMNNLGVAYAKVGRRDEAIVEFEQVLQLDPQNAEATRNLQILGSGVPSR